MVICEQDKIPGKKIIYSGVNKGEKDIREATEYGVETFTAESIRQVEMIHKGAERKNKTVPLFEGDDFSDTLKPLKEIVPFLKEAREKVKVTIEMGRFITAECSSYLTKVVDQKANQGSNYCILDGGMNHVNYYGQIMRMKVPIIENLSLKYREHREKSEKSETWCLCGSLCTSADILVRQTEIKDLKLGDIMAFYNIGAYSVTEGIYLFLSRTMPRVILREKEGKTKLLRDFFETSTINRQSEKEIVKNGTND